MRGLAFAMVLAGHAGWPLARTRAHELGVELFFVLSGFLITVLLLEEHDRDGGVALGRFYGRRLRRLLPALVVVVGATLLVASWTRWLDWGGTRRGAIGGLTYSSNIVRVHGWDLGPLGHLWSLAVEEHFYLVWPAVLLGAVVAARRLARPWIVLAAPVGLATACFVWRVWLVARGHGDDLNTRLYYPTDTRVLGPLAGCALAVVKVQGLPPLPLGVDLAWCRAKEWFPRPAVGRTAPDPSGHDRSGHELSDADARDRSSGPSAGVSVRSGHNAGGRSAGVSVHSDRLVRGRGRHRAAVIAGAAGLVALAWLATGPGITDRPAMFVAGLPLATLAGVGVCAVCATTPNRVSDLLAARPLRWLGRVSYGGYLVHYPIYFAFGYELTGMSTRQALTVITLSLVGAAIVERFVERPFRARPTPPPGPAAPAPAAHAATH